MLCKRGWRRILDRFADTEWEREVSGQEIALSATKRLKIIGFIGKSNGLIACEICLDVVFLRRGESE